MKHGVTTGIGVWVALAALSCCAAPAVPPTNSVLAFADHLYAQRDYYRAITEYKRFLFLEPASPMGATAEFRIGMAYLEGEKYETAAQTFSDLADRRAGDPIGRHALVMAAESYARMERYREAQDTLEQFLSRYPEDANRDAIGLRIGWYMLCRGERERALARFRDCPVGSPARASAERLAQEAEAYAGIPRKSPWLAGSLSAVLPGAGQVYAGRPRDGAVALLVNGCLAWAAVEAFDKDQDFAGGLFTMLGASWYVGNVYNAVNDVHKINRSRVRTFLDKAGAEVGLSVSGSSAGPVPGIGLRFTF